MEGSLGSSTDEKTNTQLSSLKGIGPHPFLGQLAGVKIKLKSVTLFWYPFGGSRRPSWEPLWLSRGSLGRRGLPKQLKKYATFVFKCPCYHYPRSLGRFLHATLAHSGLSGIPKWEPILPGRGGIFGYPWALGEPQGASPESRTAPGEPEEDPGSHERFMEPQESPREPRKIPR